MMKKAGLGVLVLCIAAASIFAGGGEDTVISVYKFSDGYSVYYDPDSMEYGYIDRSGNIAISARYSWAEPFINGLAVVNVSEYSDPAIIDKRGSYFVRPGVWDEIFPADEDGPFVVSNYDDDGEKESYLLWYDGTLDEAADYYTVIEPFHESFAPIIFHLHGGELFVKSDGNVPDDLRLSLDSGDLLFATHFSEGLCPVYPYEWWMHESGNTLYGFVDYQGNMVIEPQFLSSSFPGAFNDGWAVIPPAMESETYKVIDKLGNVINSFILSDGYEVRSWHEGPVFYQGMLAVQQIEFNDNYDIVDSSAGFVDYNGNFVIEPVFEDVWDFSEGLAAAQVDGMIGFIDTSGEFVIPPKFEAALMW